MSFESELNNSVRLLVEFITETATNNVATAISSGDLDLSSEQAEAVARIVQVSSAQALTNGYSQINSVLKKYPAR